MLPYFVGNIDATVTIILGRRPRPGGVDALACQDLDVKFHAGHASVKLDNMFGGDGDLGKISRINWQYEKVDQKEGCTVEFIIMALYILVYVRSRNR